VAKAKQPRRELVRPVPYQFRPEMLAASPYAFWVAMDGLPGYVRSADGRIAREIKVRTNKNGTRWARVSIKGKQHVIRV